MQSASQHYRSDPREADPVVIHTLKSSMVYTNQVAAQKQNAKIMTMASTKPSSYQSRYIKHF